MKNEKYIEIEQKIKTLLTNDNRRTKGKLQNKFDKEIVKLQEFGVKGFTRDFLKSIADTNDLAVRQRICRLLKNSKVLFAESYTYVKANTTLLRYLATKYGEINNNPLWQHKEYVYKLIDRFNLRRKSTIFRFEPKFTMIK